MTGLELILSLALVGTALAVATRSVRPRPAPVPVMLREALGRLADGDRDVRMPLLGAGQEARIANLFNVLAGTLDGVVEPAVEQTRHPLAVRDAGLVCVAIFGISDFTKLRQQIGSRIARNTVRKLQARMVEAEPELKLGRVGRSWIECALPVAGEDDAAERLAELQRRFEQPIDVAGQDMELLCVVGYACGEREQLTELDLLDRAELALERAQARHEHLAAFRREDEVDTVDRIALIRDLGAAAARGEFFLCYQPKMSCREGSIEAVEALIRWNHPVRGLIGPDDFIRLAEDTGAIRSLTRWVLAQAIADQGALVDAGFPVSVSVNISGRLLGDAAFRQFALDSVADARAEIGFEITETSVIADPGRAVEDLNTFAAAGVRISIDDYGSGLSSLAYLKELPARELKVDKLFISGLASSHRDPLLVRSTIDLAHALDLEVVAEGVDSPATLALLRMMGCDLVQGFLIARPMPLADLQAFLAQHRDAATEISTPSLLGGAAFWRKA